MKDFYTKLDQHLTNTIIFANISVMNKVISIYEAKTNLSKLIKKAQAGETIYIGAYGHPQAIIAPIPAKKPIKIGIWEHKKIPGAYKESDLVESDPDIVKMFKDSADRPL